MADTELLPYVGTLRVIVFAADEVEATLTMDTLQQESEKLLDDEDGDAVLTTQIIPFTTEVSPEEIITILKRARNALIKTRMKECWNTARELDMNICALSARIDPEFPPVYDYSRLLELTDRILNKKEEPHD